MDGYLSNMYNITLRYHLLLICLYLKLKILYSTIINDSRI